MCRSCRWTGSATSERTTKIEAPATPREQKTMREAGACCISLRRIVVSGRARGIFCLAWRGQEQAGRGRGTRAASAWPVAAASQSTRHGARVRLCAHGRAALGDGRHVALAPRGGKGPRGGLRCLCMFGAFRAAPGRQEGPRHVNFTDLRILGACGAEGEGQTRTCESSYRRSARREHTRHGSWREPAREVRVGPR